MDVRTEILAAPGVFDALGMPEDERPTQPYECDDCGAVAVVGEVSIHVIFARDDEKDEHLYYQGLACCECAGHFKDHEHHYDPKPNRAQRRGNSGSGFRPRGF
jgi:hypothetical protein